jgi:predicted AAA+ superfamily ATPase
MNKERLKEIILDQKEVFLGKTNLIERDVSLDPYIKTSQVVVITGVRRCGKSALLYLLKQKMQLNDEDFCYFNFDDERIVNEISLLEEIDNIHRELYAKDAILFFDEIQIIDGWEKFVNRMYEQGRKIFVTGSNASILSSEISTSLTGRNVSLELFPFSFNEFIRFKNHHFQLDKLSSKDKSKLIADFNYFFLHGGFPLVIKEADLEILDSYFKDILYRDIVARYRLSQVNEVKQIGLYFLANSSKIFSYATLQKISGVKSTSSIKDYLQYFNQSFLFFYLKKFDYSVKKQTLNPKKAFSIDQGFIHRIGFNFSANKGRILENIVYLELLRNNKDVYYYSGKTECDFVIKQGLTIVQAIQVTYNLNKENMEREIAGLKEAIKEFNLKKGLLIYYDNEIEEQKLPENIEVLPVWKWLLIAE